MTAGSEEQRPDLAPGERARSWVVDLGALLALGAALRLFGILTIGDLPTLRGDENQYVDAARAIAGGEGFAGSYRAPGYPSMLALAFTLGGDSLLAARLAQAILGLVAIALVFDLVRRRWGRRAAIASGLVIALDPTLIHYAHFLWAETLVATLLLTAVWAADRFDRERRARWLVAAGAALACGALTKEVLLYLGPVFAAWVWWISSEVRRGTRARRVALFALAMAAVILPWTARNYAVHGRFVLISNARWAPIAYGLLVDPAGGRRQHALAKDLRRGLRQASDEHEREQVAREMVLRAIDSMTPRWILRRMWDGPRKLYSAETQLGRFAQQRWLDEGWRSLVRPLIAVEVFYFAFSVGAGIVGLWLVPGPRSKPLIVAILGFFIAVHTIAFSTSRYRVPVLPLYALYVGPLVTGHLARGRGAWLRALGGALCALLLVLAIASTWRRSFAIDRLNRRPAGQRMLESFDS